MQPDDELRHLTRIQARLVHEPASVIALGQLVAELEHLLPLVGVADNDWRQRCHVQWAALEEVFAVSLDRGKEGLDAESGRIVEGAVVELRALTDERLTRCPAKSVP